jgi:hypothetical protein
MALEKCVIQNVAEAERAKAIEVPSAFGSLCATASRLPHRTKRSTYPANPQNEPDAQRHESKIGWAVIAPSVPPKFAYA